jgi:hypothetical protein
MCGAHMHLWARGGAPTNVTKKNGRTCSAGFGQLCDMLAHTHTHTSFNTHSLSLSLARARFRCANFSFPISVFVFVNFFTLVRLSRNIPLGVH